MRPHKLTEIGNGGKAIPLGEFLDGFVRIHKIVPYHLGGTLLNEPRCRFAEHTPYRCRKVLGSDAQLVGKVGDSARAGIIVGEKLYELLEYEVLTAEVSITRIRDNLAVDNHADFVESTGKKRLHYFPIIEIPRRGEFLAYHIVV